MKILAPFRAFAPESVSHKQVGAFDWAGALQMLDYSARKSNGVGIRVLTDAQSRFSLPSLNYPTTSTRLMLWLLEIMAHYIESADFDDDTVVVSADVLLFKPLEPWFGAFDAGMLYRANAKFADRPLLNSIQFLRPQRKRALAAFYRKAWSMAAALPEDALQWGADIAPVMQLLQPLQPGVIEREGLRIGLLPIDSILHDCTWAMLRKGAPPANVHFKDQRKTNMRAYFDAQFAAVAD